MLHYKFTNFSLKNIFTHNCFFFLWGGRIHFVINKIQYDNLTSMWWPSLYYHLVYHIPPASLYKQFLKLLNVHKACTDLGKRTTLFWQLFLSFLFLIQWLSHAVINLSHFQLWTPFLKRIINIEHKEFQIHVWNYGWL